MKAIIQYVAALIVIGASFSAFGSSEQIIEATVQLNDTVAKADTKALVPVAARLLKVDPATAEQVLMGQMLTLGELACVSLLSEKTGTSIKDLLTKNTGRNWAQVLDESEIPMEDIVQYLDNMNTEFAFAALDLPRKKKQ